METNIFENAKFGDKFITNSGEILSSAPYKDLKNYFIMPF